MTANTVTVTPKNNNAKTGGQKTYTKGVSATFAASRGKAQFLKVEKFGKVFCPQAALQKFMETYDVEVEEFNHLFVEQLKVTVGFDGKRRWIAEIQEAESYEIETCRNFSTIVSTINDKKGFCILTGEGISRKNIYCPLFLLKRFGFQNTELKKGTAVEIDLHSNGKRIWISMIHRVGHVWTPQIARRQVDKKNGHLIFRVDKPDGTLENFEIRTDAETLSLLDKAETLLEARNISIAA